MSIVKHLIDKMDGTVTVESKKRSWNHIYGHAPV